MRSSLLAASTMLAATIVAGTSVQAADGGFYAKADAGYAFSANVKGDIYHGDGFGKNFGDSAVLDFGFGYEFAKPKDQSFGFRGDISVGYHPGFNTEHSAVNPNNNIALNANTDVHSTTLLANVYADFTTGELRPYVGAGLGGSRNVLANLTYGFNTTASATEPGTTKTRFAWQLSAGVGYALDANATFDVGYRYLDMGKVSSSGQVTLVANNTTYTQPPVTSRLRAHELLAGVRYKF